MGDFFNKLSRYPRFLITIIVGIFWSLIKPLRGFAKNPVAAIATLGILVGGLMFLSFTLSAMLGLTTLN